MLDFRRRTRSANPLQSKQQYKLLGLMGMAALMMLLVSAAAEPKRWEWVFAGQKPAAEKVQPKAPFDPDTRLAARMQDEDEPGVFIAPPEGIPAEAVAKPEAFFPGVRADYLQTVRDDTVFREIEKDAWFHLFELLEKSSAAELAKASTGEASFRQLYQQPKEYRGRIVTVKGTVRGVAEKQAPKNTYGIEKYFQLSIEPDGEKDQLVVAYVLNLPKDFPTGDRLNERATLHAFFFKRWAYAASDAVRTAPLLLAKTITWKAAPPPVAKEPDFDLTTAVLIALGMFVALVVGYAVVRSWSAPVRSAAHAANEFSPQALSALAEAAASSEPIPHEHLLPLAPPRGEGAGG